LFTAVDIIERERMENIAHFLTCESDEEACDVDDIGRITGGVVIHLIRLSGLILNDIKQNVDSGVRVFRSGAVPSWNRGVNDERDEKIAH
jgi:hypothetical protein